MNIAVYSGSFNPLHIGHLAIISHLIKDTDFDMVYLIVSPKNPLKDSISGEPGHERYQAAIKAVSCHFSNSDVKVDDIELNMPEPHYTIRTLRALQMREPENRFTFIMGADNLDDIRRWKDYQQLLTEFGTAVYPREGHDLVKIKQDLLNENPAYKILLLSAPMVTVSSTQLREALSQGEDISHLLM